MDRKTNEQKVVRVSETGRTTIPESLRQKFDFHTPGRARFRETKEGKLVVEPVPHPSILRGSLTDETTEPGEIWTKLDEIREDGRKR